MTSACPVVIDCTEFDLLRKVIIAVLSVCLKLVHHTGILLRSVVMSVIMFCFSVDMCGLKGNAKVSPLAEVVMCVGIVDLKFFFIHKCGRDLDVYCRKV